MTKATSDLQLLSPTASYVNVPQQSAISQNVVVTDADGRSTIKAAPDTSLKVKVIEKPQMSEINPGVWDGLTPDQARKFYSEEWARFVKDPYAFRAPRAESYHDLSGIVLFHYIYPVIFILIIFYLSSPGTRFDRTRT